MLSNSYQPIESAPSPSRSIGSSLKQFLSWMTSAAGNLTSVYSAKSNIEPRVTQVQGASGSLFWEIYDPVNGRVLYCMSEEEVMQWLDSHYRV